MVPHRGTNWAALWLTAQIGRDAVLSESYGRGYPREAQPHIYVVHNWFTDYVHYNTTRSRNKGGQLGFINKNGRDGHCSDIQRKVTLCWLS